MRTNKKEPLATLSWLGKAARKPEPVEFVKTASYPGDTTTHKMGLSGKLIQGENFQVMSSLLAELEGSVDLIYADPPFLTGNRYRARVGRGEDSRRGRLHHGLPPGRRLQAGNPDARAEAHRTTRVADRRHPEGQ